MSDKKHALWISELNCDCNPAAGITNSSHSFWDTFKATQPSYNFNTLFIDEGNIDDRLREYINSNPVDIILCTLLGNSPLNPSIYLLEELKNKGKKVCLLWPDTGCGNWGLQTIQQIGSQVNLHCSFDYPVGRHINDYKCLSNHIFLWTPNSEVLYHPQQEKNVDISFLGSKRYHDRSQYLYHLSQRYPNMIISGGQRENKLSVEEYASIVRRTKIGINFSLSPTLQFHQLKGRTLEYIMSGALLLESKNSATRQFFTPEIEYLEFDSFNDLCAKIDYYLSHNEEREKIASAGMKRFQENYTAQKFWDTLLSELEKR